MSNATKSPVVLHLGDFLVECLGVEYPDYFQGYGLGPSTEFSNCCYGIGDTEAEALEDCLEMLIQSDSIDFDDEAEKRIRDEYGPADDPDTAAEKLGCAGDAEAAECGEESDWADNPPYWHVGIKWNIREEQRIERIRNIPNIQPLRYEDYKPVGPPDRYSGLEAWGYVTRADGSASYGDFKDEDWPESAEAYLGTLSDDDLESGELYFYVPCASGSDYSGCTVTAANYKCIEDAYGEHEWVHPVYGSHGTYAIAIGVTGLLGCDEDTFDEFCEILEGLADYPIIDEEALYECEAEAADEAWDSWCRNDFTRALEKKYGDKADFEWPDDPALRSFFEEKREDANEYWFNEGSGPDMYVRIDEVVKGITFDDVSEWATCWEVTFNDPGEESEVYYNEADARERAETLRANGNIGAYYRLVETDKTDKTDNSG